MASQIDSRQFDGTLKSAKDICAWAGKGKAVYGPSFATEDDHDAGLNLLAEGKGEDGTPFPIYTTVEKGDWVLHNGDSFVVFTDAQYQFAYPSK
jgi:hypothetical protein